MICEHCKERQANVTVTQVQNGQKFEHHYCEVCASQFHPFQFDLHDEPISLQQFITNLLGSPVKQAMWGGQAKPKSQTQCPKCQLTYNEFLKRGKFGCASCYTTFKPFLPPMLQKMHGGTKHKAMEVPQMPSPMKQLELQVEEKRAQLKQLIEEERFEEAAVIRDEIKALEEKIAAGGVDAP